MDRSPRTLAVRAVLRLVLGFAFMSLCFFGSAGTLRWPAAWAFLTLQFSFSAGLGSWLYRHNRELLEQRIRFTKRSALPEDKRIMAIGLLITPAYLTLPGLDAVRFGWAPAPGWLQVVAFCGIAAGLGVFAWVMVENAYLSRFVEVQAGQQVVTTGPYRVVRHPMYTALSVYFLCIPLGLGSLWGLLPAAGLVALLVARTALEDRTLLRDLPGYCDYAERVRFRLVPGLW
jgi:protein-S-isoprenylcysteine O-methyltransferase Ste14